jgi:predicted amidohydrolase
VAYAFDNLGDEVLRHAKLRPMRAIPQGRVVDEDLEGGRTVRLLHAPFGLVGIAICLDFCEIGDTPVTDLWRAVGPALVLVPSMGEDSTHHAHRSKARPLALQHETVTVVASQHPEGTEASGLFWDREGREAEDRPVLFGVLEWTGI